MRWHLEDLQHTHTLKNSRGPEEPTANKFLGSFTLKCNEYFAIHSITQPLMFYTMFSPKNLSAKLMLQVERPCLSYGLLHILAHRMSRGLGGGQVPQQCEKVEVTKSALSVSRGSLNFKVNTKTLCRHWEVEEYIQMEKSVMWLTLTTE